MDRTLDLRIARLLTIGTYLSMAAIAVGVVAMVAGGVDPLGPSPAFDPSRIGSDLAAFRPEGPLWIGLLVAIATPSARVVAALVGYLRSGERAMAGVAVLVLGVVALSVLVARIEA